MKKTIKYWLSTKLLLLGILVLFTLISDLATGFDLSKRNDTNYTTKIEIMVGVGAFWVFLFTLWTLSYKSTKIGIIVISIQLIIITLVSALCITDNVLLTPSENPRICNDNDNKVNEWQENVASYAKGFVYATAALIPCFLIGGFLAKYPLNVILALLLAAAIVVCGYFSIQSNLITSPVTKNSLKCNVTDYCPIIETENGKEVCYAKTINAVKEVVPCGSNTWINSRPQGQCIKS